MDINYFINVLQQNTETIKQLKQQIDNLETKIEVQNKTINELLFEGGEIFGYSFDASYLITNDERKNSSNLVMTKCQIDMIIQLLPRFNKLLSLNMTLFDYENIKKSNITSTTIKQLYLTPKFAFKYRYHCNNHDDKLRTNTTLSHVSICNSDSFLFYAIKFTLDGIDMLPNLTHIGIKYGYGLCNLCETLSTISHKITHISLTDCFYCNQECIDEQNKIKQYCQLHNIHVDISNTIFTPYVNCGELLILSNDDKIFNDE